MTNEPDFLPTDPDARRYVMRRIKSIRYGAIILPSGEKFVYPKKIVLHGEGNPATDLMMEPPPCP